MYDWRWLTDPEGTEPDIRPLIDDWVPESQVNVREVSSGKTMATAWRFVSRGSRVTFFTLLISVTYGRAQTTGSGSTWAAGVGGHMGGAPEGTRWPIAQGAIFWGGTDLANHCWPPYSKLAPPWCPPSKTTWDQVVDFAGMAGSKGCPRVPQVHWPAPGVGLDGKQVGVKDVCRMCVGPKYNNMKYGGVFLKKTDDWKYFKKENGESSE